MRLLFFVNTIRREYTSKQRLGPAAKWWGELISPDHLSDPCTAILRKRPGALEHNWQCVNIWGYIIVFVSLKPRAQYRLAVIKITTALADYRSHAAVLVNYR